jgi:hypothetical protein
LNANHVSQKEKFQNKVEKNGNFKSCKQVLCAMIVMRVIPNIAFSCLKSPTFSFSNCKLHLGDVQAAPLISFLLLQ